MAVLLECRLPVALLPLGSLLLLLLGLRGQHELLRYLLLRHQLRHGTRLPVCFIVIKQEKTQKGKQKKEKDLATKERGQKKIQVGERMNHVASRSLPRHYREPIIAASAARSRSSVPNAGT